MLYYPDQPTIRELDAPWRFVWCEGVACNIVYHAFAAFIKAAEDEDFSPMEHTYAGNVLYGLRLAGKGGATAEEEASKILEGRIEQIRTFKPDEHADVPLPCRITYDGKFELLDGHHRALLLHSSGKETIRLAVKVISPTWRRMCGDLRAVVDKEFTYLPVEHPWFDEWASQRSTRWDREKCVFDALDRVRDQIPSIGLYDIGCCTGRLSRYAAGRGWIVVGIDSSAMFIRVAESMNAAFGTRVAYYHTQHFLGVLKADATRSTGIVLCLSVMHHWLRDDGDEKYTEAVRTIADHSWAFVIDQEKTGGSFVTQSMTTIPMDRFEYAQWLRMEIGCKYVEYIGSPDMDRPIFLCSKRINARN